MKKYLIETWNRLKLKTGGYFQVIQFITAATATVVGLPFIFVQFEETAHFVAPEWIHELSNKAAFYAALVGWFIAKLPVKNIEAPHIQEKLPFTKS